MGSVYRESYTRPLPADAELFSRGGEDHARWIDRSGRTKTAKVTTGRDGSLRIILKCRTHTAKYRNASGQVVKIPTGCRTKDAAETVLNELHHRADKVRSGVWTAAEDSVLDHQASSLADNVATYIKQLSTKRGKGGKRRISPQHVNNVDRNLRRMVAECGFNRLRDLNRAVVERWADQREANGMGARTINAHLAALTAFGNWCVETKRIVANPLARPPKRDENADRRRTRRALTEAELLRLLKVARLRPLAEFGRRIVKCDDAEIRRNRRSRRTWTRAPLTFADLDDAVQRGRKSLSKRPDLITKLARRGRERALIYKTLVLTGLRKGELAALTIGHVDLDGPVPYFVLDAADEKAGRGADIPIRRDLADELRAWLTEDSDAAQHGMRATTEPRARKLVSGTSLFNVPSGLIRILDRDLVAAGIARMVTDEHGKPRIDKLDDRGRTIDVHALRHTFGTHLSKGGVAPRTAQAAMRHGTLELTMQTYTDPRLLDVVGALDVLPSLPLNDGHGADTQLATGTDGVPRMLVPDLVPTTGNRGTPVSIAGDHTVKVDEAVTRVTSCRDMPCASVTNIDTQRATRLERATFSLEG